MTATTPIAAPGSAIGRVSGPSLWARLSQGSTVPILLVLAVIFVIWYAFTIYLNARWQFQVFDRAGAEFTAWEFIVGTMSQDRPVLPAPHQVAVELWNTIVGQNITSRRSLVYHAWITLSATLLGFLMGTLLGMGLAVLIVHNRATDRSLMPWIIASQTVPILAIAPMVVVVLASIGMTGLVPKALISTYLSFFPVVVGMVKGLRSPEFLQLDLLRTYSASRWQAFWKLRFPSSLPYLFTSMKVGVAASLVGAIVGELPTGAAGGLGARLLAGSYYGQTVQIWSALFMAAALSATLILLVGLVQRIVLARMGGQP
ncbi:ABC transporter permease subunit [Chelativorans sp. ZYF759]|uniref:ABC transporter permease n=1 Tax=Chelativorans sp. ZYF759 TaxID=2692213 RepID=UPI00145CD4D3|nr:ABC transporter permease [Chelativorans sp. ZYF759]NMG39513.1 ABC transporter permease subunit [Chelativorans sp. ZYF759]